MFQHLEYIQYPYSKQKIIKERNFLEQPLEIAKGRPEYY